MAIVTEGNCSESALKTGRDPRFGLKPGDLVGNLSPGVALESF